MTEELLLQKLKETSISPQAIERYNFLVEKRRESELSQHELMELESLINEDLVIQVKRIKLLGEFAKTQNISVPKLMKQLGLSRLPM